MAPIPAREDALGIRATTGALATRTAAEASSGAYGRCLAGVAVAVISQNLEELPTVTNFSSKRSENTRQ